MAQPVLPTAVFPAPWGPEVKIMTVSGSILCLVLPFLVWRVLPANSDAFIVGLVQALPVIWLVCLLFCIRGYSVRSDCVLVHRLIWSTRIPLNGLTVIVGDASPFQHSVRIFGNPGIFAICGHFYDRTLGRFRAFVTNRDNCCLLQLPTGPVALSPGNRTLFLCTLLDAVEPVTADHSTSIPCNIP